MALGEILIRIIELQTKIDSFGKLNPEVLKKINYKFRLDWNYHSNAMEGNSLTQQETRSVMINNVTIEGKPLQDVLEIKGHDKVITDIMKIGKGELKLSEKRIKDIHKAIIHEDNPDIQKKTGLWKTENNYLINYKGEKFDFTPFNQVHDEMHKLINWLNTATELYLKEDKEADYPVLIAFEFHLRYVTIHPFFDGNGRTARILMNLILISFGYPPLIIKLEDKEIYNQYLADIQGYGGNEMPLFDYMGRQLIHSQELVLNAIEGRDIEEPEDLDKKIMLLEKELAAIDPDEEVKERFNLEVFLRIYEGWLSELLRKAIPVMQKFNRFFTGTQHYVSAKGFSGVVFANQPADDVIGKMRDEIVKHKDRITSDFGFTFSLHYGTLIKGGLHTFGCNYGFEVKFDYIKYSVQVDKFTESGERQYTKFKERLLHQSLTNAEIDSLVNTLANTVYQHIDFNTKKNGIR